MLDALGISTFDEHVYRALLTGPQTTVRELSGAVDATVARTVHALRRLAGLGLVRRTGPGRWEAAGPQSALTALVNRRRSEAETAFTDAEAILPDLNRLYRTGRLQTDPGSLVEVLTGRETVARKVEELSRSVTAHLWTLDKPPYLEPVGEPGFNDQETATTRMWLGRGVEVRTVYCRESLEPPGRFRSLLHLASLGEQARLLPRLPFKARIVDRRIALVLLVGGSQDSIAVVHPSGLLDALIELFEAYWDRAEPLDPAPAPAEAEPPGARPGEDELLLLRMLHAGYKDHAIGRQLGISTRTATRRVAALMRTLDARNRFQAGAAAYARGWLS
ncbi:LuxR C-terminal-related transcriptional regulator [Streptomyces sp. NPDC005423]|uniref:LuxR C-terminal-related transcriptional regulator n=1 Tax=Streptomyces sp. NPDC005423 TaxID=3155343 RepID=UPI0033B9F919